MAPPPLSCQSHSVSTGAFLILCDGRVHEVAPGVVFSPDRHLRLLSKATPRKNRPDREIRIRSS